MKNPRVRRRKEILKIRAEINAKETKETHEKMLNITHDQRNANQNHYEVPFHASQNGCDPKVYKQ